MALTKVTSGMRTLATDEITATEIAADAVGSSEIAAGAVDTAEIATDAVTANEIAAGAVAASEIASTFDISSKTVTLPAAAVTAHVTAFDDSVLSNNVAMLAFKVASGDSLTKFNMVDSVIDDFAGTTGIDTTNSSNEVVNVGYCVGGTDAYVTGDRTGTITVTSDIGSPANFVDGSTATSWSWSVQSAAGHYVRFDWGSGNTAKPTEATMYQHAGANHGVWKWQGSNDASTWTDIGSSFTLGHSSTSGVHTELNGNTSYYRYYQYLGVSGTISEGINFQEMEFKEVVEGSNLTLISTTTTAEATATTADLVFLLEDGAGSNTLGTDVKAYVSRNGNANYSSALTLVDEGDWGTNKRIITARSVDISSLTGTTAMRYKITTHNQSASKVARIHAVSLGWS